MVGIFTMNIGLLDRFCVVNAGELDVSDVSA